MRESPHRRDGVPAFSLVEVVLALAIAAFALVAIMGLFTVGVQTSKESEEQIQAANLTSLLIAERRAAPTAALGDFAIPARAMTNLFGPAYGDGASLTNYVGIDGQLTNAADAAYLISCRAGTNAETGSGTAQIYLMLTWPPQAASTNANAGHYELVTDIPLR